MSNHEDDKKKLLNLLQQAVEKDQALRKQLGIGDKFRFIRDRLSALENHVKESLAALKTVTIESKDVLEEDEALVYVHLFNAAGANLNSWRNMLNPKVFYEYSVNRPIYFNKTDVEAFIRSKPNRIQHGYLTIAVKKEWIETPATNDFVDTSGHRLIKVKEGKLLPERLFSFTHNAMDYRLNEAGEIVKKGG